MLMPLNYIHINILHSIAGSRRLNQVLAALSDHIYFIQIGAELAKLHSYYCISQHCQYIKIYTGHGTARSPAAYSGGLMKSWRHYPAIFISYKLVQNWPIYIHITIFCSIAGNKNIYRPQHSPLPCGISWQLN
jgi:hypothetical protein